MANESKVLKIQNGILLKCSTSKYAEDIEIPAGVTEIKDSAFKDCSHLMFVNICEGVEKIGSKAFYGCDKLNKIWLPKSLVSLGLEAFAGCSFLKKIYYAGTVAEFNAVQGKASIWFNTGSQNAIECSDGLAQSPDVLIENNVLVCCKKDIAELRIPADITRICNLNSFSLNEIQYDGTKAQWIYELSGLKLMRRDSVVHCSDGDLSVKDIDSFLSAASIVIPFGIRKIADSVFSGYKSLVSVEIPDSVTEIGKSAFSGCESLAELKIPKNVVEIGENAFLDCNNVSSLFSLSPSFMVKNGKLKNLKGKVILVANATTEELKKEKIQRMEAVSAESVLKTLLDSHKLNNASFKRYESTVFLRLAVGETCGIEFYLADSKVTKWTKNLAELLELVASGAGAGELKACASALGIEEASRKYLCITKSGVVKGIKNAWFDSNSTSTQLCGAYVRMSPVYLEIPKEVQELGKEAFAGCSKLVSVSLCAGLKKIGSGAFKQCLTLREIRFGGTLAEWQAVSKVDGWNSEIPDAVVHCADGDADAMI